MLEKDKTTIIASNASMFASTSSVCSPYNLQNLDPYPFPLDPAISLEQFLTSGVLKKIESLRMQEKTAIAFQIEELKGIIIWGFLVIQIKNDIIYLDKQLLKVVKLQLNDEYVKLFALLPSPKDEICNILIFSAIYIIHHQMYQIFQEFRDQFDLRFIFDCYHIILYYLNGVFVSDHYVKVNIDKYFTNKFLNYQNEKLERLKAKQPTKKAERTFLGQPLNFPDIQNRDGGSEFAKTLRECFRQKKKTNINSMGSSIQDDLDPNTSKVDTHRTSSVHAIQATNFSNMQFNVNSVSPSISSVLQLNSNQLRGEKKKMVSHQMQKVNSKEGEVLRMLRNLSEVRMRTKEPKNLRAKGKNLVELHQLSMPGKEYFSKNPRVDPFFKSMLELQYVLSERKESLQQLPSSKEVQQYLKEQEMVNVNIGMNANMASSKQRLLNHLKKKKEEEEVNPSQTTMDFFGKTAKEKLELNTELQSNVASNYDKFFTQTLNGLNLKKSTTKEQPQESVRLSMKKEDRLAHNEKKDPKRDEQLQKVFAESSLNQETSQFKYTDNRNVYYHQYDQVVKQMSTESKINEIIQNIQIRQNLVNKQLNKKIHKL